MICFRTLTTDFCLINLYESSIIIIIIIHYKFFARQQSEKNAALWHMIRWKHIFKYFLFRSTIPMKSEIWRPVYETFQRLPIAYPGAYDFNGLHTKIELRIKWTIRTLTTKFILDSSCWCLILSYRLILIFTSGKKLVANHTAYQKSAGRMKKKQNCTRLSKYDCGLLKY